MQSKLSSSRIQSQLALCAAAVAGTAAVANSAQAVVVTTFENTVLPVPATFAGVYINLATGVTATSGAGNPGWDFNPYAASGLTSLGFYWAPAPAGGVATGPATNQYADLPLGTVVQSTDTFTRTILGTTPNYVTTGTKYLGFAFNDGAGTRYGYARIDTTAGSPLGFPATIMGWRYEDSGGPITVSALPGGGVVPEPASAGLLALAAGAMTLRGMRRRVA